MHSLFSCTLFLSAEDLLNLPGGCCLLTVSFAGRLSLFCLELFDEDFSLAVCFSFTAGEFSECLEDGERKNDDECSVLDDVIRLWSDKLVDGQEV